MVQPPPSGIMIAVVGPSGAGKDSLINVARAHFRDNARIGFVKRVITRPADGATEDHQSVTTAEFTAMDEAGQFAVSWQAHDLHYGIPSQTLDELGNGKVLVVNGSRKALARFEAVYASLAVIEVTARPEVIAARLQLRGRESEDAIEKRLARTTGAWHPGCPVVSVDNSESLALAEDLFIKAVERLGAL
jgi:ribose 1,5-bisphosphokinase